jgi:formamidopyrimidine-DNA glycosylase
MPELPEVEAVAARLRRAHLHHTITACGQFRPTTMTGGEKAIGRRIAAIGRRGKNLLLRLDTGAFLRVHLKMTGNLTVIPDACLRPSTIRAWFALDDGRAVVLDDPRALGRITFHEKQEEPGLFRNLGPEPFSDEFTPQHLIQSAKSTPKPIKLLLMEQKAVVGLGNIYAAEALFQAGIHPAKRSNRITKPRLIALHQSIQQTLALAMASAEMAYEAPGAFAEGELFPLAVYGREAQPCPRCQTPIRRIPQSGRSTYYCPRCQK